MGAVIGIPATGAFAAASHSDPTGMVLDLGPNQGGLPANCPFPNGDAALTITSGNFVSHFTSNNNGGWGGETLTGQAVFSENGTPLYAGHLTTWDGAGNNAKAQTENGDTLTFHGSGPAGSLDIHANFHGITNAAGTLTANVQNVKVTCS